MTDHKLELGKPIPQGIQPGVQQNMQQNTQQEAVDEHKQLSNLLQKLEQSENLTLDELDAVIIQADAAYKSRLARLQHTRQMIDQLGTPPA